MDFYCGSIYRTKFNNITNRNRNRRRQRQRDAAVTEQSETDIYEYRQR